MLTLLHIENIAVIETADIAFDRGFNILTGETGAGKSIIIDAISAILGERAYRELIRTGADRAFVSAVFDGVPELPWFAEYGVPWEDELLIQREIFLDGRNLCRVNGRGVTVGQLRALGRRLITIHGQHDSQQLFDEQTHLGLLDAFAADGELLEAYHRAWEKVRTARAELKAGEDETLEQRQRLLMNGEKLSAALNEAVTALFGDEDRQGAEELLDEALSAVSGALRWDDSLRGPCDSLRELRFALSDAGEILRDRRDSLGDAEAELDEIGSRLDLIHKLRRKCGSSCAEMLKYLEKAKAELDDILFADEKLRQAEKLHEAAVSAAREKALELRDVRTQAAKELETRICRELSELNMPKVRFLCDFEETELGPEGMDALRFLMSANLGEALKPLSKVASGGELARIMLAMKNVMARQDSVSTLIFDEVDAGVSGRAAQKVAEKLRKVSEGRQVLCVTHLPQIAALAEHHLLIEKSERRGRTYTEVAVLDRRGRIDELARMIGGAVITETTRRSAEEMLAASG